MKIQNNKTKIATILPMIAFGVIMTAILVSNTTTMKAEAASNPGITLRPLPPLSFSTTINGHEKAEVVATVNQGETIQLDVLAIPLISDMSGNIEVSSSLPECGTINVSLGCTPQGITVSLPASTRVSSAAHLSLTISVSKDMPPGIYWHSLATTPNQNLPESLGYVEAFGIQVL
ncbi:MAG: hypothetical protein HY222_03110 [Thaumarchaeota archaeon]|nr:hypothetical protein [Nitrososphaerota archaeon]MBI3641364.1 hypothetical protein [Nitrososphaerota archaeon]